MVRIEVDYNTVTGDPAERFVISSRSAADLQSSLFPGEHVMLVEQNEYEVEAILEYDVTRDAWYGLPCWETFHDLSSAADTAQMATILQPVR